MVLIADLILHLLYSCDLLDQEMSFFEPLMCGQLPSLKEEWKSDISFVLDLLCTKIAENTFSQINYGN